MYSESTLNNIRERLNIVELIGEYVQLKKAGQGFVGLCPFHKEKSPSFHVHPAKQIFHCFGCQKGGNIFTFFMAIEGLNFPECVQRLAKRTGVTLEETNLKREAPKIDPTAEKLLAIQEWAAKYFNYLLTEMPEYRFAYEYLRGRGLSDKTIKKFRIGVSPKGWSTLLTLMLKRNFTLPELVQAGLVIQKENSPTQGYDRFRQRLMFPIANVEGAIIGFGARQLDDEPNQPKYINSPESPLFSKRRVLYGLHENSRGIRLRGEALVVEGYMDVVGLYECGVESAIATMGTALTEEHCYQIKSITRRVVTVFDPDAAGLDAWRRSVHLFISSGIFAKDLSLPDGKDPDEFVLEAGAEKFHALCEKAPRQITKLLKEIASKGQLSEEASSKVLSDLTPVLIASRRLPDRALIWDDISLLTGVSLAALREIAEAGRDPQKREAITLPGPKAAYQRPMAKTLNPIDLDFFQSCLQWPEEFLKLPKADWVGGLKEAKIQTWLDKLAEAPNVETFQIILTTLLQGETDGQLLASGTAGLFPEGGSKEANPAHFSAIAERIKKRKRELEIRALSAQVKLTQRMGDDQEQMRLLERLEELRSS